MSNVSQEEVLLCQHTATQFAQLAVFTNCETINRYISAVRREIDGTMDAILPHFMSIKEMREAQGNAQFIVDVLEHVLAIQKLAEAQFGKEVAA